MPIYTIFWTPTLDDKDFSVEIMIIHFKVDQISVIQTVTQ